MSTLSFITTIRPVDTPRGLQAQTGTASMTLADVRVGTTRVSRKPVFSSSMRYSVSVRSCPPGTSSIARSRIFAGPARRLR